MTKYTQQRFLPSWGSQGDIPVTWQCDCKATWEVIVCLPTTLQTARCVAFAFKCASIHCSEIGWSWIFPKHVTTPSHMTTTTTGGSQRIEPEAWPWLFGVCRVRCPFHAIWGSSSLSSQTFAEGRRLGKVSRCDWNTEPHSQHEATGQSGVKDLHCVYTFTVCRDLQPPWKRFSWICLCRNF